MTRSRCTPAAKSKFTSGAALGLGVLVALGSCKAGKNGGPDGSDGAGTANDGGGRGGTGGTSTGGASGAGGAANPSAGGDGAGAAGASGDAAGTGSPGDGGAAGTTSYGGATGLGDAGAPDITGGSLRIELTHATFGGDVTISGPGGFTRRIKQSTTLTGLAPGLYRLRSLDIDSPVDPSAPGIPIITVQKANPARAQAQVTLGEIATVSIDYGQTGLIHGGTQSGLTGGMWFAQGSNLTTLGFGLPDGDFNADLVMPIAPDADGFAEADTLAFDGSGGLWMSDYTHQIVRHETIASVTGDLNIASLSSSGHDFHPNRLAFNAQGDLWITGPSTINPSVITLLGIHADSLQDPATALSSVTVNTFSGYDDPESLVFGSDGNLWLSLLTTHALARARAQFFTSGSQALSPMLVPPFMPPASATPQVSGVAFDVAGVLWVADGPLNEVVGYSVAQQTQYTSLPDPAYRVALPAVPQQAGDSRLRLVIEPCSGELIVLSPTRGLWRFNVATPDTPTLTATITSPDIGVSGAQFFDLATNPISPGMPLAGTVSCGALGL
jgi:hypothetical protein